MLHFFFFFERHTINILCRRAWLILHSGGYMSKPHLDSWVKYTGQRNLWDPEKLTCRMKRSHLCLFLHPASLPHSSLAQDFSPSSRWGAHCVSWCCWAWHLPAEKIECHLIMQPSCGKHGVRNQIDRRSAQNPLCEVEMVRRAWRTVALGTTPYPKKCLLQGVAFLSASGFCTDLWLDRLFGGLGVHLREYRALSWKYHQFTFTK